MHEGQSIDTRDDGEKADLRDMIRDPNRFKSGLQGYGGLKHVLIFRAKEDLDNGPNDLLKCGNKRFDVVFTGPGTSIAWGTRLSPVKQKQEIQLNPGDTGLLRADRCNTNELDKGVHSPIVVFTIAVETGRPEIEIIEHKRTSIDTRLIMKTLRNKHGFVRASTNIFLDAGNFGTSVKVIFIHGKVVATEFSKKKNIFITPFSTEVSKP
jgi:hypothetical protein